MSYSIPDDAIVVVAIDFGTTFSGYAFSFAGQSQIHMNNNWGDGSGMLSLKTPTCVLTRVSEDGDTHEFLDFGFNAQLGYINRPDDESPEEKSRICLFNKFKMKLHTDDVQVLYQC